MLFEHLDLNPSFKIKKKEDSFNHKGIKTKKVLKKHTVSKKKRYEARLKTFLRQKN